MLYRTLVQPYIDYCNIIWDTQNNYHLKRLNRQQQIALWTIEFAKWDSHTQPLFTIFNVLAMFDTNKLQTCSFVYKAINNQLIDKFSNFFSMNSDVGPTLLILDSVSSYI